MKSQGILISIVCGNPEFGNVGCRVLFGMFRIKEPDSYDIANLKVSVSLFAFWEISNASLLSADIFQNQLF